MSSKNIIITTFLIIIPFVLLIICYRMYVYNYCENDLKCLKRKLIFNLNNINEKIKNNNTLYKNDIKEDFFDGFGSFFTGNSQNILPESPSNIDKNIDFSSKIKKTSQFPPSDDNEFKDANNIDLLTNINPKLELPKKVEQVKPKIIEKKPDLKTLFGSCQFFNDKCPDKYHPLGNFSINGKNSTLTCGNVQNTKPAHAIAQIKNNSIYEIHITDQGHGFNPSSPPKISIEGGKGHGATAEAVVDDEGFLKLIKIIHPGYNYIETPNVLIDAPYMNSSCHLCCKNIE